MSTQGVMLLGGSVLTCMDTFWHIFRGALEAIFIILILWISFDFGFMETVLFLLLAVVLTNSSSLVFSVFS